MDTNDKDKIKDSTKNQVLQLRKNIILYTAVLRILETSLLDSYDVFQKIKISKKLLRRLLYD